MPSQPSQTVEHPKRTFKPIFKEAGLERELNEKGYVVVPFVDLSTTEELLRTFNRTTCEFTSVRLYETSRTNSSALTKEIIDQIYDAFKGPAEHYFQDYNLWGGSFIAKTPLNTKEFRLHQDWNVVEEDRVNSAIIWCPLVDVTSENGALFVIEGSHRLFSHLRSGSIPPLRISVNRELQSYYKTVEVQAGHALIFYDSLFHGSWPYTSGQTRVVAQGRVMQNDGEFVYYHRNEQGEVGRYRADPAFFSEQINLLDQGQLPKSAQLIEKIEYEQPPLTLERLLLALRQQHGNCAPPLPADVNS